MLFRSDVEAGLHTLLGDDPVLVASAREHGVRLRDLREAPAGLGIPRADLSRPAGVRVVHTVGTDCAIGKMSTALELTEGALARGHRGVFVPTGQTGIAIAGWGIAIDQADHDRVVMGTYTGEAARADIESFGHRNLVRMGEGKCSSAARSASAVRRR